MFHLMFHSSTGGGVGSETLTPKGFRVRFHGHQGIPWFWARL